jgi:SAM-dependent methyltransferase
VAIQGEIDYLKNLVADEVDHAVNKPFSDFRCGRFLVEMGTIFTLLPPPPARILDLGCGTGWTSCLFARRGYDVVGQDIAPDMIYHARRNRRRNRVRNLRFVVSDYEDLDFDEEFHAAVFFDSLHHSLSEENALRAVYRALGPGGICITSEPGQGHARSAEALEAVKRFNVTERDMPPHQVVRAGKRAGFRNFKIYPQARHIHSWLYGQPEGRSWKRWIKSTPLIKDLALTIGLNIFKRYSGLVVMTK